MKIIEQNIIFEEEINGEAIIRKIERAAVTCYLAEHRIGSLANAQAFVRGLISRGHESTIEHVSCSARVITNRGVSHEWVRHRVGCSYSQESTRYCNYGADRFGREITVIWPWFLGAFNPHFEAYSSTKPYTFQSPSKEKHITNVWLYAMQQAEKCYFELLDIGCSAQEARGVLPNDLKTEFVVTMTLRAWRHFFTLRCSPKAHPQIRELAVKALSILSERIPVVFDDLVQSQEKEGTT